MGVIALFKRFNLTIRSANFNAFKILSIFNASEFSNSKKISYHFMLRYFPIYYVKKPYLSPARISFFAL